MAQIPLPAGLPTRPTKKQAMYSEGDIASLIAPTRAAGQFASAVSNIGAGVYKEALERQAENELLEFQQSASERMTSLYTEFSTEPDTTTYADRMKALQKEIANNITNMKRPSARRDAARWFNSKYLTFSANVGQLALRREDKRIDDNVSLAEYSAVQNRDPSIYESAADIAIARGRLTPEAKTEGLLRIIDRVNFNVVREEGLALATDGITIDNFFEKQAEALNHIESQGKELGLRGDQIIQLKEEIKDTARNALYRQAIEQEADRQAGITQAIKAFGKYGASLEDFEALGDDAPTARKQHLKEQKTPLQVSTPDIYNSIMLDIVNARLGEGTKEDVLDKLYKERILKRRLTETDHERLRLFANMNIDLDTAQAIKDAMTYGRNKTYLFLPAPRPFNRLGLGAFPQPQPKLQAQYNAAFLDWLTRTTEANKGIMPNAEEIHRQSRIILATIKAGADTDVTGSKKHHIVNTIPPGLEGVWPQLNKSDRESAVRALNRGVTAQQILQRFNEKKQK